ncbi:MAG TPA: Ig-like domain-containing protein, partial [Ilumatobacteraceae bacterium]
NTFVDTQFRWDFGDGVTAFGEVATHAYQRPGTYTAVLRVSNGLRTSKATSRVIVIPDEPLVADAGDDRVAEEQLPIAFDGGASLPYFAIESYQWDFGDGESGVGRNPQHIYTTPGIYAVTLTVRSGDEEATDTLTVDVREQGAGGGSGGLEVTVLDDQGAPIRAADVAVLDADGTRHSARTGDNGVASLKNLPDGRYSVYAYKLGFRPTIGRARVLGGLGTAAVTLARGAVGQASLEQRRLTLDEIIAAGIDINDPANLNVLEFEIQLGFRVDPNEPDILGGVGFMLNGEGEFVDIPIDWICNDELDRCEYSDPDVDVSVEVEEVEGQPVVTVLIIPVKASWLKEFFEVTMIVANLAPKGFAFTDGAATIDLSAGLTLAPTTDPQSLMVDLPDIPAGKTGTARWIVRGDRAGEYDLGAAYTGVLEPLGVPVLLTARTNDPLKVWGTDAVNVRVRAQQQVRKGKPYLVRLGIENVSDGPIYNVAAELGDLGGDADFEYAPWTSRRLTADQVDPQTTTWFDIWLIPGFNGSLVSCNLCARGPAGRSALLAIDEGVYDTADLAGAFSGLAAGTSKDTDPSAVEIEPRADEGLTFTATSDGGVDHLAWAPVAGATGYEVWAVGGDAPLATLTGDVTEWTLPSGASAYVLATVFGDEVKDSRHPIAVPGAPVTPPVVTPDDTVAIAGESTVIDVLGNDADPSGGPLTITNVVQPEHGTVTCDDEGKCTYTPDDGFEGTDSFEVTVAGSNGVEVTHVVTVTVAAAGSNRNPVAVADALTVEAEIAGVVDVLANDSDPDDDSLTLESFTQPAHGVVDCTTGGECTYTSDLGFDGFDAFTYEVSDGDLSAQAAVAVTVTPGAGGTTTTSTTTTSTTSTTTSTTSTTTTTVPDTTSSTTTTTTTTVPPSSSSTTTTTAPSSGGSTTTTTAPQGGGGPP